MSGELQLGGGGMQMQQQQMQQQQQQIAPAAAAATAYAPFATTAAAVTTLVPAIKQPTTVVELKQMLTLKELIDDTEYEEILEDTRDECTPFGTLKNVIIPRTGPGATKIFLEYMTVEDAGRAIAGLAGRTFDGRKVEAVYFDPVKFANQDYFD
jgi:splicing factor U2AF subunit